jgi:hypothetical protein
MNDLIIVVMHNLMMIMNQPQWYDY